MSAFETCLDEILYSARMLIPGTCTLQYYLARINNLRRATNNHSVILDTNHCIVVL